MRRVAWGLLVLFAFAIPWEYSLELGAWLGNIARVTRVLLLVLAAIPAVLQTGRLRGAGADAMAGTSALSLVLLHVFVDHRAAGHNGGSCAGICEEMMAVWLVWEFTESPQDLRSLLRAFVAGSLGAGGADAGQLPVRRRRLRRGKSALWLKARIRMTWLAFLIWVFPWLPCWLIVSGAGQPRLLALGYLPLGGWSRSCSRLRGEGSLAALAAIVGSALLLLRNHTKGGVLAGALADSSVSRLRYGSRSRTKPSSDWRRFRLSFRAAT